MQSQNEELFQISEIITKGTLIFWKNKRTYINFANYCLDNNINEINLLSPKNRDKLYFEVLSKKVDQGYQIIFDSLYDVTYCLFIFNPNESPMKNFYFLYFSPRDISLLSESIQNHINNFLILK